MIDLKNLEDGAYYIVEFPFTSERGDVERMVALYEDGRWLTPNDGAYEDGPIPGEVAGYTVIENVDIWAA
jgi:hypothetical protein